MYCMAVYMKLAMVQNIRMHTVPFPRDSYGSLQVQLNPVLTWLRLTQTALGSQGSDRHGSGTVTDSKNRISII